MGKRRRGRGRKGRGRRGSNKLQRLTDRLSDYTPVQPDERIRLETDPDEITARVIDIVAPIGKGQRVLITSPPKAGKTMILKAIAQAVHQNHPDIYQIGLLIDERPEEATDFKRTLPIKVYYSTTDKSVKNHVRVAERTFENAIGRLLDGQDVLILMDSLTRLARAYNNTYGNSGRTLSGGVTAGALDRPRQLFGAARNFEEGGSLTIIATALVDTGSRMDEVIFQEFKGTGNSEVVLNRKLSQRRLFPAVDINATGTRKEMKLLDEMEQKQVPLLRRKLAGRGEIDALEWLLSRLDRTRDNADFLKSIN